MPPKYYRQNGAYYTLDGGRPSFVSDQSKIQGLRSGTIQSEEGNYFGQQNSPRPQPTTIQSPTPAPTSTAVPTLPTPIAPATEETYVTSLTENAKNIRKTLEDTYKTDKAAADKKLEEANIKDQGYLQSVDPATRPTYNQERTIMQNELNAAESASGTIKTNFDEKQRLVGELEKLLTEGNAAIAKQKTAPVAQRVLNVRVNNTVQDVAARTGVIEAVLSARDGQISQAHNIINEAAKTVKENWNDHLTYYNTLLDYNNKKIINLDKKSEKIAQDQIDLIKYDLEKVDKSTDYLQKLMIDPDTAQFMADAGVKITDSIEEINTKMGAQAKIKEVADFKKELLLKGYEFSPIKAPGTKAFTIGGQTLYFKTPADLKAGKSTVYNEKNIPGDIRTSVIDTLNDAEGAKAMGRALTITDLATMFPEVNLETLQSYMDQFYDYDKLTNDGQAKKKWWQFWR